jgi:hypothetical protein
MHDVQAAVVHAFALFVRCLSMSLFALHMFCETIIAASALQQQHCINNAESNATRTPLQCGYRIEKPVSISCTGINTTCMYYVLKFLPTNLLAYSATAACTHYKAARNALPCEYAAQQFATVAAAASSTTTTSSAAMMCQYAWLCSIDAHMSQYSVCSHIPL